MRHPRHKEDLHAFRHLFVCRRAHQNKADGGRKLPTKLEGSLRHSSVLMLDNTSICSLAVMTARAGDRR
jgi:hypothetical protein